MADRQKMARLSGKEGVVLDLLMGPERYGLELVRESNGDLAKGTVYVTLARMEEKGLVESRLEAKRPDMPGMPRRLYKMTGLGERALRAHRAGEAEFFDAEGVMV